MNTVGERRNALALLKVREFRNYEVAEVELSQGFNLIVGANAQGKTNLLEAIHLLSTTRLLRSSRDNEAIRFGSERSDVEGMISDTETEIRLSLQRGVTKKAFLNSQSLGRASDLLGRLPSTTISLPDLSLARGDPSDRRLFLDIELSQSFPAYLHHLATYRRAIEHRNALLKAAQTSFVAQEHFETWDEPIAHSGAALREYRSKFVGGLHDRTKEALSQLVDQETIELDYEQKDESVTSSELMAKLEATRQHDIARGSTGIGPHRDDLKIEVDGHDLRKFGSQGQQRSAVIAIKMASMQLVQQQLGLTPILLLDDIFAELDERRRQRFVEMVLTQAQQSVLTCTEASAAGPLICQQARIFEVNDGTVMQTDQNE